MHARDEASLISTLWNRGARAVRSGRLSDAYAYLSSAARLLGERLADASYPRCPAWPLRYLEGVRELIRRYLEVGEGEDDIGGRGEPPLIEEVYAINIRSLSLLRELSAIVSSCPSGPLPRLAKISEEASSLLAEARSIAGRVMSDDYSYGCLKAAVLNLEVAEKAARGLSSFLEGIDTARAGRLLDAEIAFRRALRLSYTEHRGAMRWCLMLGLLYKGYALLARGDSQGGHLDYAEACDVFKRAAEISDEPRQRGLLIAASSLSGGYADLLRFIGGRKESGERAAQEIASAHSMYRMLGEEREEALCAALGELIRLLVDEPELEGGSKSVAASRLDYISNLLKKMGTELEKIASLEHLITLLRPGRPLIEGASKVLPRRLVPIVLEPPHLGDGLLIACPLGEGGEATHAQLVNIGYGKIRVEGGLGVEADALGPLEATRLSLPEERYAEVWYSNGAGRRCVVFLRREAPGGGGEATPLSTGLPALDSQIGGGLRNGSTYLLLVNDSKFLKRLVRSIAGNRGVYTLVVSGRQSICEVVEVGENVELVFCGPRVPSDTRVTSIRGVEDLSLLTRVVVSKLEEKHGGYAKGVIVFDVLSDILLLHKLLTTRRWINDVASRLGEKGWVSTVFLLNTQLHGREEVHGVAELIENVAEVSLDIPYISS